MTLYFQYTPKQHSVKELSSLITFVKRSGFGGIFISMMRGCRSRDLNSDRKEIDHIINTLKLVENQDLVTGIIIETFHNPHLYSSGEFTPPQNMHGVALVPSAEYHPVCPNNPDGLAYFHEVLRVVNEFPAPDYLVLDHLRYPFDWQREQLDVQHRIPPYCYCPFCVTEFSSMIGEIVASDEQITDYLPEWLEWRSGVILDRLLLAKRVLHDRSKIVVTFPPLSPIDLPFTTGQLPRAFIEEGCLLVPEIHHHKKKKEMDWVEDLLHQYRLDIKAAKLIPSLEIKSAGELGFARKQDSDYAGILIQPQWHPVRSIPE